MAKVLVRFVSPNFKIEEATVSLFNTNAIYQDWTKAAEAFSVFPLRPAVAEIEVGSPGLIEGSLIDIVLRRTAGGTLNRINFCRFNEDIAETALRSGKFDVDLSSYKEVILRARRTEPSVSYATVFNISIRDNPIPTFDLTANALGESTLLAKPGQYRVCASTNGAMKDFEITNGEVEPRVIEF
jgi:hypothetical protein